MTQPQTAVDISVSGRNNVLNRIARMKYYYKNKDKELAYKREWRKKNKDNYYTENKRNYMRSYYYKVKDKESIRANTRNKYGKLPLGFQYHHTTLPYNVDIWIGVDSNEHKRMFK